MKVSRVVSFAAIAVVGLACAATLVRLIFVRSFNYDELSHAHMVWLVSVGEVPYRDFAANHFPFLWILLSPLISVLPGSLAALMVLRGLALLGNAIFIGVFGALICSELRPDQRLWAAACLGLVVFSPPAMHFLIEFRPDPFANALLFSAIAWLRFGGMAKRAASFASGLGIGIAVMLNTKYLAFPFVLGAVALVMYARRARAIWPSVVAVCLGFGASLLGGALLLQAMHIPLADAWRMVVTYNAEAEKAHTFGFGLARALRLYPEWLAYGGIGLAACVAIFLKERRIPDVLSVAIFIWLLLSVVTTARPWKQYVVSWLILAAYFPSRSLPSLIARLRPMAQAAAACCIAIVAIVGLARAGIVDPNGGGLDRKTQDRVIAWMLQKVPRDGFVVTSFHLHPVFRKDTFFKTVFDIAGRSGDGLERFMPQVAPGPLSEHFQLSGYQRELELRPPSVIVGQEYTNLQVQALEAFLASRPGAYEKLTVPDTSVVVLQRQLEPSKGKPAVP